MKIYWIVDTECSNLLFRRRCFFRLTKEEAQHEVDFRIEESKKPDSICSPNWVVEEEEVPDSQFGVCLNGYPDPEPMLPSSPDCSVGMIRKLRNGLQEKDDDGKCGTCPNFRNEKPL